MAREVYEHIFGLIIVGAIFASVVFVIPNTSYINLFYMDQQQLRNIALKVLNAILLETGYPGNWGSQDPFDPSSVHSFGLASSYSSSFYLLDPDKVQRLVTENPSGYLEYEKVRQLLGLQDYGFDLRIVPPFNVTVVDLSQSEKNLKFNVTVTLNDEKPLPNAAVTALIVYSHYEGGQGEDERYSILQAQAQSVTDELGQCTISKVLAGQVSDVMVVFKITAAGVGPVNIVFTDPPPDIAEINMINDTVLLTHPKSTPNENRWICDIAVFTEDGVLTLYDGTKNDTLNYGSNDLWSKTFRGLKSIDPVFLFLNVNAVEKGSGRKGTLTVGPYPNYKGSRVLQYGGTPMGDVVKLQRTVSVADMDYILELMLWKES